MDNKDDLIKNVECKFAVEGMTCHSCELMVERSWKNLPGVREVKADSHHGTVKIISDRELDKAELQKSLLDQKYKIQDAETAKIEERKKPSWSELIGLFALAIGLAWVITHLSGLVSGGQIDQNISPGAAMFLGLLASLSSCVAVVSGLLISSTAHAAAGSNKTSVRVMPVVMFLAGRVASYSMLGGILGWMGAKFAFSPTTTALILAVAALYMILIGLDMLHLLPASVRKYLPGTPKVLSHGILNKAQRSGIWLPVVMGAATFFLPCGFTQALQAYALTTGSFAASAAILGAFAVGTIPGLMLFGLATTAFKGKGGRFALKVAGALVVVLGLLNLRNGVALAGISLPSSGSNSSVPSVKSDVGQMSKQQIVKMVATDAGYKPSKISIKVGIPVRWEVDNQARGCAGTLVASSVGINAVLKPGVNEFNFVPKQTGTIRFSCSMGMYTGQFTVSD
ncbi:MAG: sulfite exporter TauE/SafE family protein [Patescibacteria group bacterium]|jgi:sulfite exporter TauE/SafE/copper chaperone CopZ